MTVLAAEQIPASKVTSRYFDKYVFVVSVGIIIAVLIVPYIQDKIPIAHHYKLYLVMLSTIFMAALLFLIGWRYYIRIKTTETVVTHCIPVLINALQTWYRHKRKNLLYVEREMTSGSLQVSNSSISHVSDDGRESAIILRRPLTFFDFAKTDNRGKYKHQIVDDVKTLRKAFIVFILLIPYWLLCNQVKQIIFRFLRRFFVVSRSVLLCLYKVNI